MKKLILPIALFALGLAIVGCNKEEEATNTAAPTTTGTTDGKDGGADAGTANATLTTAGQNADSRIGTQSGK